MSQSSSVMDLWLSFIVGAIGYCVTWLFVRLSSRRTLPQQHAEIRERVIVLFMRWIEAEQERLYCEHELVQIREEAPDDEALWIVHSINQLRSMPPIFTQLAKKFGFKVPKEKDLTSPEPMMAFSVEPEEGQPTSAWGSYNEDSGSGL